MMVVTDLIHTTGPADLGAAPVPLVLDRSVTADAERMNHLVGSGLVRSLHDTIDRQIEELLHVRARRRLSRGEVAERRARLLDGADPAAYGRWVFFPWSGRLVHVLGWWDYYFTHGSEVWQLNIDGLSLWGGLLGGLLP